MAPPPMLKQSETRSIPSLSEGETRAQILAAARALIGKSYSELDCSHMVHSAYKAAGLIFPYKMTSAYSELIGSYFTEIDAEQRKPGDLVLYAGHVGIYDPDGCTVVNTVQCQRLEGKDMRILSARSGNNLGTDYGRSSWFGTIKSNLCWSGFKKTT